MSVAAHQQMKARKYPLPGSQDEAQGNAISNVRAAQAWPILIGLATQRQTITYGQLGKMLGYTEEQARNCVRLFVAPIVAWCKYNRLPLLSALVVNSTHGWPYKVNNLYGDADDWARECERVFGFDDWFNYYAPTAEELESAVQWAVERKWKLR